MKTKHLITGLLLGLVSTSLVLSTSTVMAQGFLRTQNHDIVNEQGEKVILRGMGLGGWMLQEGYMLKVGEMGRGQQYFIRSKISELIGPEATQEFYDAWLTNHTTKADIDAMAQWGFNSVRLPMHYNLYTLPIEDEPVKGQNTWLEKGFQMTDELIAWSKANNMYVILDLHAAPGGQGNDLPISDRDPTKPSFWENEANREKTIALWRKLAQRYANEPWVGAYDVINEPNWGFEHADDKHGCKETKNEPLKKFLIDVTKAIREVDSKHMIIIEGNCWGNNYAGITPDWDKNMALSFHKYWTNNNLSDIGAAMKLREQYNMPIWLGESGENSNLWYADVLNLVESQHIGWAFWPLKKLGLNNPLQVPINPGYQKLLDYWLKNGEKPTAAEAKKALMQLATDTNFKNNNIQRDVIDAMFRQVNSYTTIPFKEHRIGKTGQVLAVDYDLGRSGHAYWDKDSANYHISAGTPRMPWNKSMLYRSDGVDIGFDESKKAYYVNSIEDGEWLEYTVTVEKAGTYQLSATTNAEKSIGKIALLVNNTQIADVSVPQSAQWQAVKLGNVQLLEGINKLRVRASAGGYNLLSLDIKR